MKFDGSGILFLILLLLEITAGKGKVPVANTESSCVFPFVTWTVFLRSSVLRIMFVSCDPRVTTTFADSSEIIEALSSHSAISLALEMGLLQKRIPD